jgi:putative hemolysin
MGRAVAVGPVRLGEVGVGVMSNDEYDPNEFMADSESDYCIDCGCLLTVNEMLQCGGRCVVCDLGDLEELP